MVLQSIWTEKYRPSTFDKVVGQNRIVEQLRAFVKQRNMPHLMFAGTAGIGKSTLALVVAKELFKDDISGNFLELNASDERGIDVIRNKVKDFARTKSIGDIPFKIIFLDECDALTKEAQQALRRTMENFSSSTRFILSCNYASKIIDPIQSRCTVYKFQPLKDNEMQVIIDRILSDESLVSDADANSALIEVSEGDCRKLENTMQAASSIDKKITKELVYSIANVANPKDLKDVLKFAIDGKFEMSRNKLQKVMIDNGLSGTDIIKQIQKEIFSLDIDSNKKVLIVDRCAETEFRMVEGSDEFIQLEALLAYISLSK